MTASIPSIEPTKFQAGETVQWTKSLSDYKASDSWALTYYLRGPSQPGDISASASGDDFSITIAAATTANFNAGEYRLIGRVSKSGEVHTIYDGRLTVEPDLSAADAVYDPRSDNEIILDNILAVLKGSATFEQSSYQIAGRALNRHSPEELSRLQDKYQAKVNAEKRKAAIDEGRDAGSGMYARL